jgi:hypothetical protein
MKLKYLIIILVSFLILPSTLQARRLYYAEEFYLYVMNLYHTNPSLDRNIRFLQWALKAPFDNPVKSLALIQTENDFKRYKALFRMHCNLLIIDSYLQLARRFDKEHVYYFNLWYAQKLKKSFTIAQYYYETGLNYWEEAQKYAVLSGSIPGRINIDFWEEELYLIENGKLDYETIITAHLAKLKERITIVDGYLGQFEQ